MLKRLLFMMFSVFLFMSCGKASQNQMVKPASESKVEKKEVNQQKQMENHKKNITSIARLKLNEEFRRNLTKQLESFLPTLESYLLNRGMQMNKELVRLYIKAITSIEEIRILVDNTTKFYGEIKGLDLGITLKKIKEITNKTMQVTDWKEYKSMVFSKNGVDHTILFKGKEIIWVPNMKKEEFLTIRKYKNTARLDTYLKARHKESFLFLAIDLDALGIDKQPYSYLLSSKGSYADFWMSQNHIEAQLYYDLGDKAKVFYEFLSDYLKKEKNDTIAFYHAEVESIYMNLPVFFQQSKALIKRIGRELLEKAEPAIKESVVTIKTRIQILKKEERLLTQGALMAVLLTGSMLGSSFYQQVLQESQKVQGFLWKLEHQGAVTYLYGANYYSQEPSPLDMTTYQALKKSDFFVVELDFRQSKDLWKIIETSRQSQKPLKGRIPDAWYAYLMQNESASRQEYFKYLSLHGALVEGRIKKYRQLGYKVNFGSYRQVEEVARQLKKEILPIYTSAEEYFKKLAQKVSEKGLRILLKKVFETPLFELKKKLDAQAKAWKEGDLLAHQKVDKTISYTKELEALGQETIKTHASFLIENCLKKAKHCFFIGSGTMFTVKNGSIIEILKKKGYKLTRIK